MLNWKSKLVLTWIFFWRNNVVNEFLGCISEKTSRLIQLNFISWKKNCTKKYESFDLKVFIPCIFISQGELDWPVRYPLEIFKCKFYLNCIPFLLNSFNWIQESIKTQILLIKINLNICGKGQEQVWNSTTRKLLCTGTKWSPACLVSMWCNFHHILTKNHVPYTKANQPHNRAVGRFKNPGNEYKCF